MMKKITEPIKGFFNRFAQSSNSVLYGMIALLVGIGPILFVPVYALPVISGKGILVILIAILGVLVAGVTVLKKGALTVPTHKIFWILGGIVLVEFLGALLSPSFSMALLGYGFETTTWLFVAIMALMILFSYKTVTSYQRVGMLYGGMLLVGILLILMHAIRFMGGPSVLSFGVLGSSTGTLVGSWGDLGIFFAVIALFSVITLELGGLKRLAKWTVMTVGLIALIFLAFMNIAILWIVLGLVSLLGVLYLFSFAYWDRSAKSYRKENRVPWYVLGLFALSIVGMFFGGALNRFASQHQNLAWNDIRPSLMSTVRVAGKSILHNPVTGYGPNSFGLGWNLAKPVSLSGTSFGTTDFTLGFSTMATQIAMNGIVTGILWIGLFGMLGYILVRRLSQGFENSLDRYMIVSLGMMIAFLGTLVWVYVPGTYPILLFAIMVGAFLRMSLNKGDKTFSFIKDPRASFFGIFGVTLLIIGAFIAGYFGIRKLISFIQDTKGLVLISTGKRPEGALLIDQASRLASHDTYHVQLAGLALADTSQIISSGNQGTKEAISRQAEQVLGIALGHAKAATESNPLNYRNWVLLGNVYQVAVSLGVNDAYQLAQSAYTEAAKRNPNDSTITLLLANLALANKDNSSALSKIEDSITRYPTQSAYLLKARIQLSQGAWSDAVTSLQAAIVADASNPILYVYLGVAYEKSGDLANATKIYDLIRKQFKDGDETITNVRNQFGGQTISVPVPDVTSTAPATTTQTTGKKPVAPSSKR